MSANTLELGGSNDSALRKALGRSFPSISEIRLTDYKVRVVNSEAGTAAKVRVFIEFQDKDKAWTTVGVHENIIEASWQALLDSILCGLLESERSSSLVAKAGK